MNQERIVAVGFLTEQDLHVLGSGFDRLFPVEHDGMFADLLAQLDTIEASPIADGVVLRPTPASGGSRRC